MFQTTLLQLAFSMTNCTNYRRCVYKLLNKSVGWCNLLQSTSFEYVQFVNCSKTYMYTKVYCQNSVIAIDLKAQCANQQHMLPCNNYINIYPTQYMIHIWNHQWCLLISFSFGKALKVGHIKLVLKNNIIVSKIFFRKSSLKKTTFLTCNCCDT